MRTLFIHIILVLIICSPCFAGNKKIVLASLDWPPYSGDYLYNEGASIAVARAAFKAVGYDVEIRYYPWQRVVHEATQDNEIVGYVPEYFSEERDEKFYFSDSIGRSPVAFAERAPATIRWKTLDDLAKYTIGTVRGYVNEAHFDQMVRDKLLTVDESVSDTINLRKVLNNRVDISVVDVNVFKYLTHNDEMLSRHRSELSITNRLLTIHDLYVCFRRTADGKRLRDLFNEGLKQVGRDKLQDSYLYFINR